MIFNILLSTAGTTAALVQFFATFVVFVATFARVLVVVVVIVIVIEGHCIVFFDVFVQQVATVYVKPIEIGGQLFRHNFIVLQLIFKIIISVI